MFKAVDKQTDQEIIILSSRWANRLGQLRVLDRQDNLVCQHCRQPVRVRAGQIRRRHFAHKHLQNCPLQSESPEILAARAILYEWLDKKFGDAVTLEKQLGSDLDLPRPVDCWVETEYGIFVYWIIEVQIKPAHREGLQHALAQSEATVHWVFLSKMLREDKQQPDQVHLTTTEREFMVRTKYDQIDQDFRSNFGCSLHYLDPAGERLTTFRNLHLVHRPQVYAGHKEDHSLAEVLVSPRNGEFVHPGEYERLQAWKAEKAKAELEIEEQKQIAYSPKKDWPEPGQEYGEGGQSLSDRAKLANLVQPGTYSPGPVPTYPKEAICELCGNVVTKWYVFNNVTKTCKCMDCYRRQEKDSR